MSLDEIEVGMTCRLGKAKTAVQWEVVKVLHNMGRVHLSKLGGDGFVNKHASVEELRDVQPRKLPVCLAHVLDWQDQVQGYAKTMQDRARFFGSVDEVAELDRRVSNAADAFKKAAEGYYDGIAEHYPHLAKEA